MIAYNILSSYNDQSEFNLIECISIISIFLFLVLVLHWYRQKISTGEKSVLTDFSKTPLYKSRDILMQEKHIEGSLEYIPLKVTSSIFLKIIIVGLILILFLIPFGNLLSGMNVHKFYY